MPAPKYKEEYCQIVIDLMEQGKSPVQVAAHLKVDKGTLYDWAKDLNKPEFIQAWKTGKTCYEAYHEEILQKLAKGILKGSAPAQIYMMKCRFRNDEYEDSWKETTEQRIEFKNDVKKLSNQEIDDAIKALLLARHKNNTPTSDGSPVSP